MASLAMHAMTQQIPPPFGILNEDQPMASDATDTMDKGDFVRFSTEEPPTASPAHVAQGSWQLFLSYDMCSGVAPQILDPQQQLPRQQAMVHAWTKQEPVAGSHQGPPIELLKLGQRLHGVVPPRAMLPMHGMGMQDQAPKLRRTARDKTELAEVYAQLFKRIPTGGPLGLALLL